MKPRLTHPSDKSGRWVRTAPYPNGFRPRHCAGALDTSSGCLHHHADDEVCGCGQVILGPENEVVVLQVVPNKPPTPGKPVTAPWIRHSRESCHQVSAASVASGAVSA